MDELFTWLEANGKAIGSRVWGGASDNSDYDWMLPKQKLDALYRLLRKHKLDSFCTEPDVYDHDIGVFQSIRVSCHDGKTLNFIIVKSAEYAVRLKAAEVMEILATKRFWSRAFSKKKDNRVYAYNAIQSIIRNLS